MKKPWNAEELEVIGQAAKQVEATHFSPLELLHMRVTPTMALRIFQIIELVLVMPITRISKRSTMTIWLWRTCLCN